MMSLSDYTVIDIETTGLDPDCNGITELAALRVRNGEIVDQFQELANPGVPIPCFLEEKTHITNEMVRNARPMCEVLASFLDFIGQDILMGYNIDRFDKMFIAEKVRCELHGCFSPETFDVFPLARRAFRGQVASFKLDALRDALGIEAEGAHRALKDCRDTYQVYRRISTMPPTAKTIVCLDDICFTIGKPLNQDVVEELARKRQEDQIRDREIMGWFPVGFSAIDKSYLPTDYRERWPYVRRHPFATLSGAIVSITGSSSLMPRETAEKVVGLLGATLKSSTTRCCDFCVVLSDCSSGKLQAAKKWREKGSPIQIISDEQFIDLVKMTLSERPQTTEEIDSIRHEIEAFREKSAASEMALKEWIKVNLKKRVKPSELHSWRQEFSELWNRILEDNVIETAELAELRVWLLNHMRKVSDYKSMLKLMDGIITDGVVDYEESIKLFDEAEKCLLTMGASRDAQEVI